MPRGYTGDAEARIVACAEAIKRLLKHPGFGMREREKMRELAQRIICEDCPTDEGYFPLGPTSRAAERRGRDPQSTDIRYHGEGT